MKQSLIHGKRAGLWVLVLAVLISLPVHGAPGDVVEGISFKNDDVPVGSTNPAAGAQYVYDRSGSQNARVSPVDITLEVFDKAGRPIHQAHQERLTTLYQEIYGWDFKTWKKALEGRAEAGKYLLTKSNFFWESLAQQMAERLFGDYVTPAVYLFGPTCVDGKGKLVCPAADLKEAHTLVVTTRIDGARDPLNSVERKIVTTLRRGAIRDPELFFTLDMPFGLKVASTHGEELDVRPVVGGRKDALVSATIEAHVPPGTRERFQDLHYPDYSLLFVPVRHLVFQGEVKEPRRPGSSLSYENEAALQKRFSEVVEALRKPETAAGIAAALKPFMTADYYYMFEGGQGVEGYAGYLLGPHGLLRGLEPDFGKIELKLKLKKP